MAKDKEGHGSEKRAEHGKYAEGTHAHGDDYGKMREELVGKGTDYKTTKKIVEGR